ncbi:MAG: hypothetical protein JJ992_13905 [Planctomycetes bacterium]|jgi:hypothetical protein|nr:hypothetical protein [Planctomycetota bacterium]
MRNEAASMAMATAAALTLAACQADTITTMDDAVAFDAVEMVTICHLNVQTGSFQLLVPTTGKALDAHLAHGDLFPGDPLPGGNGTMADDCSGPVLPVLAIAYTDMDANDGAGYREGVDRPVSVLLDANLDGVVSVGDEVRVYGFPVDFGASAFGSVAVSSHTVARILIPSPDYIYVFDADESGFYWLTSDRQLGWEAYVEEDPDGYPTLALSDGVDGTFTDKIETALNGDPSRPDRTLLLTDAAANGTDDTFIDIQITLGGN